MEGIDFNSLEFNLYELLGIPVNSSSRDAKKAFRKIVKRFHPDKISKLEEKIYYNITIANHVLTNENTKIKYDNWLLKSNQSHIALKNKFKKDKADVKQYFPKTKRDAHVGFLRDSDILLKRHGNINEDNRNFNVRYKEKNIQRKKQKKPIREDYNDMDEFNDTFTKRKKNGIYSDNIIKYDKSSIVPYEKNKRKMGYIELKDFNKLYVEDTVQTDSFTSLDRAFGLQPVMKNPKSSDINYEMEEYNNLTDEIRNNNFSFDI